MIISIWEVITAFALLLLAMWVASKLEFRGCDECTYDCNQGRDCPNKENK